MFVAMVLPDHMLIEAIKEGRLEIDPFEPKLVQPASIDVRLDNSFRIFNNHENAAIDPREPQEELTMLIEPEEGQPFVLHPGEFVLGSTLETVGLGPDLVARFEGRSSLGRLGLATHVTAGFIDPGFRGQITLEFFNVSTMPIFLRPGTTIGQLCVEQMAAPAERPYGHPDLGSKYQGQSGPTASQNHKNFAAGGRESGA